MERAFAKFVSFVFHPLLIPTIGTILILNLPVYYSYTVSLELKNVIYTWMFFSTFLLPTSLILILRKNNIISSLQIPNQRERIIPSVLTLICYIITMILLQQLRLPLPLNSFILGAIILILLSIIINQFFFKISIHALGVSGLFGAIYALSLKNEVNTWLLLSVLSFVAGVTCYSRLKLDAHNGKEILAGLIFGFLVQWSVLYFDFLS